MKVKVNAGYQGPAKADGSPSQPGDVVDVEASEGAALIASGIASKVTTKKAPAKAVSSSKNKAVTESKNK